MQTHVLLLIIGLLFAGIIMLFGFVYHYKSQRNKEHNNYTEFVDRIDKQKEEEKEVAGRRRITPKMKQTILERDNYTCQICGMSKSFLDNFLPGLGDYLLLEIDHIESVANGGTGKDEDNLQVLCWRCNRKKGGKKTNEQVKELIDYGVNRLKDDKEKEE